MVRSAVAVPDGQTSFVVDGMTLRSGNERELALVLPGDFDGDGKKDALVVLRPVASARKPGTSPGALAYFRGSDQPSGDYQLLAEIAAAPAGLPPGCAPTARLEATGDRAAYGEIGSVCARGAGTRGIFVLRMPFPGGGPLPQVVFDGAVTDPAQASKLTFDATLADRDGDGIDDIALRLTVDGATERLLFFDRPAGPSRDPDEPEASLRTLAASATARAGKAKDAAVVLALVGQVRALYRAACAEGGAPRITAIRGGGVPSCGASKALEDVAVAEVRALAAKGDVFGAFAAAELAQVAPATKTPAKSVELQKALAEVAPVLKATTVKTLAAPVDRPGESQPEWGPLAFEASGKLLVRKGTTVVRVDPATGDAEPSDVPAWKTDVVSPDGKSRWIEAYHACDGIALRATFAPTGVGDNDMAEVVLPVVPRMGKPCSGARGEPAAAIPIAWGPRGLSALVAGQPVLMKLEPAEGTALASVFDDTPVPGSPLSAGKTGFALATPSGVLTRGKTRDKWAQVRSSDLEPYADLRRCVASDDGSKIACLRASRGTAVLAVLR
jgi:hypothetical protein